MGRGLEELANVSATRTEALQQVEVLTAEVGLQKQQHEACAVLSCSCISRLLSTHRQVLDFLPVSLRIFRKFQPAAAVVWSEELEASAQKDRQKLSEVREQKEVADVKRAPTEMQCRPFWQSFLCHQIRRIANKVLSQKSVEALLKELSDLTAAQVAEASAKLTQNRSNCPNTVVKLRRPHESPTSCGRCWRTSSERVHARFAAGQRGDQASERRDEQACNGSFRRVSQSRPGYSCDCQSGACARDHATKRMLNEERRVMQDELDKLAATRLEEARKAQDRTIAFCLECLDSGTILPSLQRVQEAALASDAELAAALAK
eukprot:6459817-Amphidinium_carterae.2